VVVGSDAGTDCVGAAGEAGRNSRIGRSASVTPALLRRATGEVSMTRHDLRPTTRLTTHSEWPRATSPPGGATWRERVNDHLHLIEAGLGIEHVRGRVPGAGFEPNVVQVLQVEAAPLTPGWQTAATAAAVLKDHDPADAPFGAQGMRAEHPLLSLVRGNNLLPLPNRFREQCVRIHHPDSSNPGRLLSLISGTIRAARPARTASTLSW